MPHKKTDDDSGPKVNDLGIDPHLQIKIAPILSSIRDKCLRMGQHGFDLLRRKVNARDARIETKMDPDKFRMSLMDLGIMLSGNDVKHLALAFKDGQGYLRVNMLCDHICGFLSPERQALVDAIFELLDVDRSGQLEIADLKEVANFSQHPAVLSGKMSADAAMRQYLDIFESDTPDGVITREEFHAYYAGVSENCPTLEYFEDVVRSAWKFLDLSRLKVKKAARRSERSTPADEGEVPKGNVTIPPRTAAADAAAGFTSTRGTSPTRTAKRVVGYTGHVPMARERFGETFHRIDAATPELTVTKEPYYGPSYVDEKNSFKRQGNKSNAHSFKFA